MSEPSNLPVVETEEPCAHSWRVLTFEATTQLVGYKCRKCGISRVERPADREESRP